MKYEEIVNYELLSCGCTVNIWIKSVFIIYCCAELRESVSS